ncbi:MAG: DUF4296 domain-containing protein [Bacteroidetes bacterium]|nr:MAG: DUF4296 domain-containing protein [Bacteroidota bacterium]TAG88806.1 MAG: DUF4296 domain-containing protein [Bacteroidota bacterium]
MKKNIFFIILVNFLFLFFISCSNSNKNIPVDIIRPEKMRAILIDIHLLEGKIAEANYINNDSAIFNYHKESNFIWKKHKIDSSYFRKSFKYYTENPKIMTQIYQEIVDSLSLKEVKAKAKEESDLKKTKEKSTKENKK